MVLSQNAEIEVERNRDAINKFLKIFGQADTFCKIHKKGKKVRVVE